MPDLQGLSARTAVHWLSERGIEVRVRGQGAVVDQWPRSGEPLPQRATLRCQ
jgi:hypothetical protein